MVSNIVGDWVIRK